MARGEAERGVFDWMGVRALVVGLGLGRGLVLGRDGGDAVQGLRCLAGGEDV